QMPPCRSSDSQHSATSLRRPFPFLLPAWKGTRIRSRSAIAQRDSPRSGNGLNSRRSTLRTVGNASSYRERCRAVGLCSNRILPVGSGDHIDVCSVAGDSHQLFLKASLTQPGIGLSRPLIQLLRSVFLLL